MGNNKATKDEEELTYILVDDVRSNFWHHFWNVFWVFVAIWFVWGVFFTGDNNVEGTEYYESPYESPDIFTISSGEDLPISYSIHYDCGVYMKTRIRDAFYRIYEETDYYLTFEEITNNADIKISCPIWVLDAEEIYTAGEATLGIIGYSVTGSEIDFYDLKEEEVWEMSSCDTYPDTEIHEILHTFGFDHNEDLESIMNIGASDCYLDSIDDYIIECLKYTYSEGGVGTDCSNRDDVVGSPDDVEYEYEDCENGWYNALNDKASCCPDPGMKVSWDGYCF